MCGGLAAGRQLSSPITARNRSVTVASDSMYPSVISVAIAATPERENLDTKLSP